MVPQMFTSWPGPRFLVPEMFTSWLGRSFMAFEMFTSWLGPSFIVPEMFSSWRGPNFFIPKMFNCWPLLASYPGLRFFAQVMFTNYLKEKFVLVLKMFTSFFLFFLLLFSLMLYTAKQGRPSYRTRHDRGGLARLFHFFSLFSPFLKAF